MEPRKRTFIGLCLVGVCASVLTATAAGLYDYTPEEQTGPEQPIAFNHEIHAGAVEWSSTASSASARTHERLPSR